MATQPAASKDKRVTIVVRRPHPEADVERLIAFFTSLPASVKLQLRYNVSDRDILKGRLAQVDGQAHWRLVAEVDGRVVADATMDRDPFSWTRHIANMRVVCHPSLEDTGAREALCDELVKLARGAGVERICMDVLREHIEYVAFLESMGFTQEVVRKSYAKGVDGRLHDVIICTNDLESVWRHLEDTLQEMDTRYAWWSGE